MVRHLAPRGVDRRGRCPRDRRLRLRPRGRPQCAVSTSCPRQPDYDAVGLAAPRSEGEDTRRLPRTGAGRPAHARSCARTGDPAAAAGGTRDPHRPARSSRAARAHPRRARRADRSPGRAQRFDAVRDGAGAGRRHRDPRDYHRPDCARPGRRRSTTVTKHLQTLAFIFAFALASPALVSTQEKDKDKPPAPAAPKAATTPVPVVPLKVQIQMTRYQGDKKISSMPYTLSMLTGIAANLRMGTKVPVTIIMMTNVPKDAPTGGPVQYQDVGTNIDCTATPLDDGRFSLRMTIEDSSVFPDDQGSSHPNPAFRSFRASNGIVLKNGETGTFTTATDKVTGETVKVDVTLTVVK